MRLPYERLLSTLLTVAALVIAVVLVRREIRYSVETAGADAVEQPEPVANWRNLLPASQFAGDSTAPVVIVELSDLECPACRQFHRTLRAVQQRFPGTIAHAFIHHPLGTHRFARPAARAAECAAVHGAFDRFVDAVYDEQDSIGLRPWIAYAQDAGMTDTDAFVTCSSDTAAVPRIDAGLEWGERIGLRGTPTVIVNGWRFTGAPSEARLVAFVDSVLVARTRVTASTRK